jgi:hypothetical protein
MKFLRIRRIDPISVSLSVLLVYAAFFGVLQAVHLAVALLRGQDARAALISLSTLVLVTFSTSLAALVVCLVYNLIARWTGGIRIDVQESGPEGTP